MDTLVFQPLTPMALWVGLAAAGVALWIWYARDSFRRLERVRWTVMVALMAVNIVLPLVILLNPLWMERIPPPAGKLRLTLLIDATQSMAHADSAGRSRFDDAKRIASTVADRLAGRFDVRLRTFADKTRPTTTVELAAARPVGEVTNLASAISESLEDDLPRGQALLLLSDGIHNGPGGVASVLDSAARARAMNVPVYTKTLGGSATVCDLAVELLSPQELAFIGQKVPVRALLRSSGLAGQRASVHLVDEHENILATREVTLPLGKPIELQFDLQNDLSGLFRYEVRADPLPDEVTTADNRATLLVRVIDEPIRVLLLEGKPYWDTKFLMRTLAADRSIELVSVVKLADSRFLRRELKRPIVKSNGSPKEALKSASASKAIVRTVATSGASALKSGPPPTIERSQDWSILADGSHLLSDAKMLSGFQVVVLGRDSEAYLTDDALQQIKLWLRSSCGSLVCFRGAPTSQINQRLSQLLPVRWESARETRFRMRMTDLGRDLRWIATADDTSSADADGATDPLLQMPTLATNTQPSADRQQGETLAVGEENPESKFPVLTSRPFGASGRVVVVEGSGMWRWALLAPKYASHEAIYGALWQSLIHWLVSNPGLLPSQKWKLTSDQVRFHTTEPATATLLIRESAMQGSPPSIELRRDGQKPPMSTVQPALLGSEPGAYRASFGMLPEGRYEARIAGAPTDDSSARTLFDVQRNLDEMLKLDANPNLMKRISSMSGGGVLESATPDELAEQLSDHLSRSRPEQVRTTTAWDRWWVLAGLLFLWSGTWGLRRRSGLV